MAVLETACPHCHRQSQFKLFGRIAEGPSSRKVAPRTQWGYAFQRGAIASAQKDRREYETKKAQLTRQLPAKSDLGETLRALAELQQLEEPPIEPALAAFSSQCTFADCGGPALLVCHIDSTADEAFTPGNAAWDVVQLPLVQGGAIELVAIFPASTTLNVHPSWPSIARSHLPELVEDLARGRDPSRILAGARSVLDVVLKDLVGENLPKGRTAQILKLQETGLITAGIADWAKSLWKDGSDASHDGSGDRIQASAYLDFLKVLLQVAYVLPAEIETLKAKSEAKPPSA